MYKSNNRRPRDNKKKFSSFEEMLKDALKDGREKSRQVEKSKDKKIKDTGFKIPYKKIDDENKTDKQKDDKGES